MKANFWLAAAVLAGLTAGAQAQRAPHIGYVYPAGGRQGATIEVVISGQYLDGVTNAIVSGDGVEAVILSHTKPLNGRVLNLLRDRQRNMQEGLRAAKKGETIIAVRSELKTNEVLRMERTAVEQELANIRKMLSNPKNQRPPNPQLAEDVKLRVTIAAGARLGDRELRLKTGSGLSNPLVFAVDQLPEFSEPAEVSLERPRYLPATAYSAPEKHVWAGPEQRVSLPCIVNGQIQPGDVDRIRFAARQGQKLVINTRARDLIPYLADAVPGWFQATVTLYDAQDREVAYVDDFNFNPDPVLLYEVARDGEYVLEIRDSIYRGREDFVYRITMGELPFITSIFPLGARVGSRPMVEIKGWNLPGERVMADTTKPGTVALSVTKDGKKSNPMPFAVDLLPEVLEQEPNNQAGYAQAVSLPAIINGRVDKPGDQDIFSFQGRAGDRLVAEIQARRLNSPLDSILRLTDAAGKQIALNDDFEDKGAGLTTHHADSRLEVTLPANGTYQVHVNDAQGKGGADYAYRLRLSPPQPDFELRIVPSSVAGRGGASVPITVYVLRKDGFSGDIALALKGAPPGFNLASSRVPGGTNQVRLNLVMPANPPPGPVCLNVEGRALIQGQEVVRAAVPAEDMMQAFAYRHLVPAQNLVVAVTSRGKGDAGNFKSGKNFIPKNKKTK